MVFVQPQILSPLPAHIPTNLAMFTLFGVSCKGLDNIGSPQTERTFTAQSTHLGADKTGTAAD